MSTGPDKARRKELLEELRRKQRADGMAQLPADRDTLQGLFDMLDRELPAQSCDHTLRLTKAYLAEHELVEETVLPWLHEHGGHCDCEVLANVEEYWLGLTGGR